MGGKEEREYRHEIYTAKGSKEEGEGEERDGENHEITQ